MAFAEKLKIIRKQAGMSQEQLAEKLGVSRQAVTKWETDAGIPDIQPKGWYLVFLLYFSNLILHL
jgi:transcriptional regulator with XRE-family HTH domain